MIEEKKDGKTIYVEPNKKEFKNMIYRLPDEIQEAYVDDLRSGKVFKKYDAIIQKLTLSGTTLQDRANVEMEYIKKDMEYLPQCYFNNMINYGEYMAGMHNILNAFTIIRHNWNLQHPVQQEVHQDVHENL